MPEWTIYILRCADDTLYTGITTDIDRRLQEHNQQDGAAARYTRSRQPVTLAYTEASENRSQASRREAQIKKLSRAEKLSLISTSNFRHPDSADS
jgi:putative endonuclease